MTKRGPTWWIRLVVVLAVAALVVLLLSTVGHVVRVLLVGGLLAYLLDPLVRSLEARGLTRTQATTLIFVGTLVVIGVALVAMVPLLLEQLRAVQDVLSVERIGAMVQDVELLIETRLAPYLSGDIALEERVRALVATYAGDPLDYLPGALVVVTDLFIVPFVVFFALRDGRTLKKRIVSAVPNRYFELILSVIHRTDQQLGGYLRGQLIAALIVGMLATFALWLLEVPYYVLIGIVAGLTNLIPYVGPIVGAGLAMVVSVVTQGSFEQVLGIGVAFVLIQAIDNVGVQPLVLSRNVELHPVFILLSILVGGQLFGALGLLLAVPVAAIAKVAALETVTSLRRYHLA